MGKNTYGTSVAVTIFGESHGAAVGAVLDGIAPGIPVDPEWIRHQLSLRRPWGSISTGRRETDEFEILSGVFEERTTGTPICIVIRNQDTRSKDYAATRALARPGHADYTAYEKYHGFEDYRGGGHFSGRVTAGLVAAGAVALAALKGKGILVGTHIARCGGVADAGFADVDDGASVSAGRSAVLTDQIRLLSDQIRSLSEKRFAVLDEQRGEEMQAVIRAAAEQGDSVGGILETAVAGLPAGVGEPWFDTLEGCLSHMLFSVPAVKGVEFGAGFDMADARGSEFNDPFRMENGEVRTRTNHNGGVNGGITNGMPVLFRCMVKPTPSIYRSQETVNFQEGKNAELQLQGRHDPAIVHRARVVVDSVTALVLCDLLALRFGTDWLRGE